MTGSLPCAVYSHMYSLWPQPMASTSALTWKASEAMGLPAGRVGQQAQERQQQVSVVARMAVLAWSASAAAAAAAVCCSGSGCGTRHGAAPATLAQPPLPPLIPNSLLSSLPHQRCGARCSARWRHPTGGPHGPGTPRPAGRACGGGSAPPRGCGGAPTAPAPACRWRSSSASRCGRRCRAGQARRAGWAGRAGRHAGQGGQGRPGRASLRGAGEDAVVRGG
jgi:hypothetical protein